MRTSLLLFRGFLPVTASSMVVIVFFIAGRLHIVPRPHVGALDRAVVEHLIGGVAMMVAVFGVFTFVVLPKGMERPWPKNAYQFASIHALAIWSFHLWWEFSQAYASYISRVGYPRIARGYVQWDQVAADAVSVVIGFLAVRRLAAPVYAESERARNAGTSRPFKPAGV